MPKPGCRPRSPAKSSGCTSTCEDRQRALAARARRPGRRIPRHLHQGPRSTRIEIADNTLITVLNDVPHRFSFDRIEISTLWAHVTPHAVISARRKPLVSIERLRQDVLQGAPLRSSGELLIHLLRDRADVLANIVREAVEPVDTTEDRVLAGCLTK